MPLLYLLRFEEQAVDVEDGRMVLLSDLTAADDATAGTDGKDALMEEKLIGDAISIDDIIYYGIIDMTEMMMMMNRVYLVAPSDYCSSSWTVP